MLLHYPVRDAQPESHAFSDVFTSEKRIKNFREILRWYSLAVVSDNQKTVIGVLESFQPDCRYGFSARLLFQSVYERFAVSLPALG